MFFIIYQLTTSCKSSEIRSTTITHWRNSISRGPKPSWSYWKTVSEARTFRRTPSYSNRNMEWLWEVSYPRSLATLTLEILKCWLLARSNKSGRLWLRYVYEKFVVWPHGTDRLQNFFRNLSTLRSSIKFTMEIEANKYN
jgi:hypothetical protein